MVERAADRWHAIATLFPIPGSAFQVDRADGDEICAGERGPEAIFRQPAEECGIVINPAPEILGRDAFNPKKVLGCPPRYIDVDKPTSNIHNEGLEFRCIGHG